MLSEEELEKQKELVNLLVDQTQLAEDAPEEDLRVTLIDALNVGNELEHLTESSIEPDAEMYLEKCIAAIEIALSENALKRVASCAKSARVHAQRLQAEFSEKS